MGSLSRQLLQLYGLVHGRSTSYTTNFAWHHSFPSSCWFKTLQVMALRGSDGTLGVRALTRDHTPDLPNERKRIIAAGGLVVKRSQDTSFRIFNQEVRDSLYDTPPLKLDRAQKVQ
jgi:hypothetical protein